MKNARLLDDAAMQDFIRNGYTTVNVSLPPSFHDALYETTEAVFEKEGNPGNNMIPRIPALQKVLDDPAVHGALSSILGPDYYPHPHRHPHRNPPGSAGQQLHKDSWMRRHHHPRWAMAFYYPQDTPEEMGPTGIVPGSQYFNAHPTGKADRGELPLSGEAGTVVIVHYDVWHRAMPNRTDRPRYMMKFLFARLSEPRKPTWNAASRSWPDGNGDARLYRHMWNWYVGDAEPGRSPAPSETSAEDLAAMLASEEEYDALNAAYALGEMGESALPYLIEAIHDDAGSVRRNAGYGLTVVGEAAVAPLIEAAQDETARLSAINTLTDLGLHARAAVPTLIHATGDASAEVRAQAVEGLGIAGQGSEESVSALAVALKDEDGTVRRHAALALLRLGRDAASAVPALIDALEDENRYVRAHSLAALRRIGTDEAREAMLEFLITARWCPTTTRESTF